MLSRRTKYSSLLSNSSKPLNFSIFIKFLRKYTVVFSRTLSKPQQRPQVYHLIEKDVICFICMDFSSSTTFDHSTVKITELFIFSITQLRKKDNIILYFFLALMIQFIGGQPHICKKEHSFEYKTGLPKNPKIFWEEEQQRRKEKRHPILDVFFKSQFGATSSGVTP